MRGQTEPPEWGTLVSAGTSAQGAAIARLPRVVFTVTEGQALQCLSALLGRGKGSDLPGPVRLDVVRPELLAAGARRVSLAVLRYLTEGGGWRARTVLRGGERVTGRAWDRALNDGWQPVYTVATKKLWLDGARVLPGLTRRGSEVTDEGKRSRRSLRDLVSAEVGGTGDWVVMHLALQGLSGWQLGAVDHGTLAKRLRLASPLALLFDPDPEASREVLLERYRRLLEPEAVRLPECLEDRLALAWTANALTTWNVRAESGVLTSRWQSLGRAVDAWVSALDGARRLDLARSTLTALRALADGPLAVGGEAVRATLAAKPGVRSLDARDALLDAVRGALDAFMGVLRLRDTLAGERYGDPRYAEGQVLLRAVDEVIGPRRRLLEGVSRSLEGAIG